MSFKKNTVQQLHLFDSYIHLSDRNRNFLLKSWAPDFAELVFPYIDEQRFAVLYSETSSSRPNTPINIIIGSLMLKEMLGLTDEELLESILFDIRFQYALHTTSFKEQPVSDRTFSRFRERLYYYELETGIDLMKQEMLALAGKYTEYLNLNHRLKRMDSIMIASSCKKMSRLELFYTCIFNLVRLIQRTGEEELLSGFENYLEEDYKNKITYRCEPQQEQENLEACVSDAIKLLDRTGCFYNEFKEYQDLDRIIKENVTMQESGPKVIALKEVPSTGLLNPSDPDATFRKKSGKRNMGYVGNFVETVDTHGSIITQYDYQPNIYSDHTFCSDVLEELKEQAEEITLIADGAYSGRDVVNKGKEKNIKLVTTSLTGPKPDVLLSEFHVDEDTGEIKKCPCGFEPKTHVYNKETGAHYLTFEKGQCEECPNKEKCRTKIKVTKAVVRVNQVTMERAKYLKEISEGVYEELQRKRSGVEGIPSILRRRYQVDHIPVRGFLRSKMWFSLKMGAINVVKLIKANKNRTEHQERVIA